MLSVTRGVLGKLQTYKLQPTKFYEKGHRAALRLVSTDLTPPARAPVCVVSRSGSRVRLVQKVGEHVTQKQDAAAIHVGKEPLRARVRVSKEHEYTAHELQKIYVYASFVEHRDFSNWFITLWRPTGS